MLLRDAVAGAPDTDVDTWRATITAVAGDGTVSVSLPDGSVIDSALCLDTFVPAVGDAVAVRRMDTSQWLVQGKLRTSNPASTGAALTLAFPFTVLASVSAVSNPLVIPAVSIRSYRSNEGWSPPEAARAAQGAYSSTWGWYRGCYFYGAAAFGSVQGRTASSLSIRLSRHTAGGIAGAERQWLALHAHPTQPGGSPKFVTAAVNVGSLAWGANGTFTLPTWWGQWLIDGRAAGVGHLYSGTADYSICKSLAEDSLSGRLTLGWS